VSEVSSVLEGSVTYKKGESKLLLNKQGNGDVDEENELAASNG
jgi:hypothetical protein